MMTIKQELLSTLASIDSRLKEYKLEREERAMLLVARVNILMALQKYE